MSTDDKERIRQARLSGAVEGLGIHETGLSFRRTLSKGTLDSQTKVGHVQVKKCAAHRSSFARRFKLCQDRVGHNNSDYENSNATLLHPMKLNTPEGSITAILGSSNSGKSTLLKFMAGCLDSNVEWEGTVNLPGTKSYCNQDNDLHRFTPRTYIKHYDRLLSSSSSGGSSAFMSDVEIEKLLDSLRIDPDRRDVRVGGAFHRGLTVGEQKRLEIGLLVLSDPDTLFLENPVEGLDSETSLHIMEFLKGYTSSSSRRVVVTLNRPSNFIWNLIDNAILLSRGRVVFEGARFDMEGFFASNGAPTPKRFSPIEHYLSVVNNFRRVSAIEDWETNFKTWQEEEDDGDDLGLDNEACFPSYIPDVHIDRKASKTINMPQWKKALRCGTFTELTRRYLGEMILNPGILQIRLVMYAGLSLFLGALFFNLDTDYKETQSINSHAALLFYSSSFYIFMVCVTIPFLAIDLQIRNKEVTNGLYHPITHYMAISIRTIPGCLILALVISVIQVNMVGHQNGVQFFLILTLALWCADALSMLVSLCSPHFVIGIVVCAAVCGVFMALEGFMLQPSQFPLWLHWLYPVPFHTYVFSSLMANEFQGQPFGEEVLIAYEIEHTSIAHSLLVLFCYGLGIHVLSIWTILLNRGIDKKVKDS